MLGEVATVVLALAGLAIAGFSIVSAVSARGARHHLRNGLADTLGRIEDRQLAQDERAERIEAKVDKAHGRITDLAVLVNQERKGNRS